MHELANIDTDDLRTFYTNVMDSVDAGANVGQIMFDKAMRFAAEVLRRGEPLRP